MYAKNKSPYQGGGGGLGHQNDNDLGMNDEEIQMQIEMYEKLQRDSMVSRPPG